MTEFSPCEKEKTMNNSEVLTAVIQQLREIFLEKSEIKGYDEWNSFFGCINAIQTVATALAEDGEKLNGESTD